jgi:hypothetical protein
LRGNCGVLDGGFWVLKNMPTFENNFAYFGL